MFKQGDTFTVKSTFTVGKRTFKPGARYWVTATNRSHSTTVQAGNVVIGTMRDHIGHGVCVMANSLLPLLETVSRHGEPGFNVETLKKVN